MHKQLNISLLILLLVTLAFSTKSADLDSLKRVWDNREVNDTIRLEVMQRLIYEGYSFSKPEYAYVLAKMQQKLANKIRHKRWEAKAYNNQAITFSVRSDPYNAMDRCRKALKLYEIIGDKKGMASTLSVLGDMYFSENRFEEAKLILEEAALIAEQAETKQEIASIYLNLSKVLNHFGILLLFITSKALVKKESFLIIR